MTEARVTLICTKSRALTPPSNKALPAVPEEAHIMAPVMTQR
jgi:hypothetical protein